MKRVSILVTAALLAAAAQASAATVTAIGTQISFAAAAGETNRLTVTQSGTTVTLTDTNAPVTAGAGCAQAGANAATCPVVPGATMFVNLGDLNDTVTVADTVNGLDVASSGGEGHDVLIGGDRVEDSLNGGNGNDVMSGDGMDDGFLGGAGNDTVDGGPGNDAVFGQDDGNDVYDLGPGDDNITLGETPDGTDVIGMGLDDDRLDMRSRLAPLNVSLDGIANDGAAGEQDNVSIDVEDVEGGKANDVMSAAGVATRVSFQGSEGDDTIIGGSGDDNLDGWTGDDTIDAGAGNDFLQDLTGVDTIAGGPGDDEFSPTFDTDLDTFSGGPGLDRIDYLFWRDRLTVSLDGVANDGSPGRFDNVGADIEDVVGTFRADTIIGNAADNHFVGKDGNDTLVGGGGADGLEGGRGDDIVNAGAGSDTIDGGEGADRITSRDRETDEIRCGSAVDTALVDAADTAFSCEVASSGMAIVSNSVRVRAGRVTVTLTCPSAEGVTCRGVLRLGVPTLGSRSFVIPAGATRPVVVPLTAAGRRTRGAVSARVTFRDASGAQVTTSRSLTIRR